MKIKINKLIVLFMFLFMSVTSYADDKDKRYFLFVGEPTAAAWKYLINNPQDREDKVKVAMRKLGGEVLSYYFGLGDGKNYIMVTLPNDNISIQALYLMRLPTGLLKSYNITEMMPSAQMAKALKKSAEYIANDKTMK